MPNPSMEAADLDSTIAALQNNLVAIAPDAAFSVIDSWQQQLQGTEIGTLLDDLKSALSGTSNRPVGDILSELAAQTTSAAGNAGGELGAKLAILGQLLAQASSSLSS